MSAIVEDLRSPILIKTLANFWVNGTTRDLPASTYGPKRTNECDSVSRLIRLLRLLTVDEQAVIGCFLQEQFNVRSFLEVINSLFALVEVPKNISLKQVQAFITCFFKDIVPHPGCGP